MGCEEGCWPMNDCWPAGGEVGAPLLRFHKRKPIAPSRVAPSAPPTAAPTSTTVLLLLLLPLLVSVAVALVLYLERILDSELEYSDSTDATEAMERLLKA